MTRPQAKRRGISLLESMIAMAVLSVGVLGVIQALLIASNQNAVAGRMLRATAIANTVRATISTRGLTQLIGANGALAQAGVQATALPQLVLDALRANRGGSADLATALDTASGTTRFLKLDDDIDWSAGGTVSSNGFDSTIASTAPEQTLLPYMDREDHHVFDVYLAYNTGNTAGNPTDISGAQNGVKTVLIIVVWREGGQLRKHLQAVALYDTGFNQSGSREIF